MTWTRILWCWPSLRGIHRSSADSHDKGLLLRSFDAFNLMLAWNKLLNKPSRGLCLKSHGAHVQGWGQFHFFNSIPIPIPLFSIPIPIPIPLLTKSFNSNSNSNSGHFNSNSNSNSGEFKSNLKSRNDLLSFFLKIDYDYNNKVHLYKIVINTISLISLVKWL